MLPVRGFKTIEGTDIEALGVVDASSVVGSVGVVASGWGYTKVMKKYGVERRVMTSGANKVRR